MGEQVVLVKYLGPCVNSLSHIGTIDSRDTLCILLAFVHLGKGIALLTSRKPSAEAVRALAYSIVSPSTNGRMFRVLHVVTQCPPRHLDGHR
jgi:hypothetical protein